MLLRHSAYYLMARGVSGIINFLAIAIYTRILSPEDYGRYILVIAGVGLFDVVLFQWLRLSMSRFLPAHLDDPKPLLSTVLAVFLALVLLTGCGGIVLSWIWPDHTLRKLIILAVPLLWAQAWFELNLSLSAVKLLPGRYGLMYGLKSACALAAGAFLIVMGLRAYGPLLGVLVGMLASPLIFSTADWRGVVPRISQHILSDIMRYGLPLTALFALSFVVSSSDRFLIAWFLGEGQAGIYAAAYDLGQQSLTLMMSAVNLAAHPLAVRALEQRSDGACRLQLKRNGTLLLAIAMPSAAGMAVLAPNISSVMLGAEFREDAARIIPWIALAILLSGMRAFHFDLAFQLGRQTIGQVWVVGAAAVLNIILNLWWIPAFGLMGAAYATAAAYLLAILMSAAIGRKVFQVPVPFRDLIKIALASSIMALLVWINREPQGAYALAAQVLGGAIIYIGLIGILNVGGYRKIFLEKTFWSKMG